MRVLVIGLGHVGLVVAACLAEAGHRVFGVDIDEAKVATLSLGQSPIFETGLDELLTKHLANGALDLSTNLAPAISDAEAAGPRPNFLDHQEGVINGKEGSKPLRSSRRKVATHFMLLLQSSAGRVGNA